MARILIVDDNPDVRAALRDTLEAEAHEVSEAKDARDIVDTVLTTAPDAVLMDVTMRGIDGFQALSQLRANASTAAVPIIMVTARSQKKDLVKARDLGAQDYIIKPWASGEVEQRLRRLLKPS